MNLCIKGTDYNILPHLCEHVISRQIIFFRDTILRMIISIWPLGERKPIIPPYENSCDFIPWTYDK